MHQYIYQRVWYLDTVSSSDIFLSQPNSYYNKKKEDDLILTVSFILFYHPRPVQAASLSIDSCHLVQFYYYIGTVCIFVLILYALLCTMYY